MTIKDAKDADVIDIACTYEANLTPNLNINNYSQVDVETRYYDSKSLRAAFRHGFDECMRLLNKAQPHLFHTLPTGLYIIERDKFEGVIIGEYLTIQGREGWVLQQEGTKVVHVYSKEWVKPTVGSLGL